MQLACRLLLVGLTWALLLTHSPSVVNAKLSIPKSLDQDFEAADVVAVVRVTDYHSEYKDDFRCAVRYTAEVTKQIKPKSVVAELKFGRYDGLTVGHSYLLFLRHVSNPSEVYEDFSDNPLINRDPEKMIDLIKCNGTVPGLAFDPDAAWEITDAEIRIVGLLPRSLPKSIEVSIGATAEWFLRASDVFSYLEQLATRVSTGQTPSK